MMAPVRTWAKSLALSLSLALLSAVPVRAEADIVFGPSPRALDNQTLFGADTVPVWRNLHEAGVQEILLNGTFLMKSELRFGRNENGTYIPRPEETYLRQADLDALARLQRDLGFSISYEAGAGLSGDACRQGFSPEERGRHAARQEFDQSLQRLSNAGISILALNVDGPFLRLIEGSTKQSGCLKVKKSFDIDTTVRTVHSYLVEMRELVTKANNGNPPQLRLVVNLPNWRLRGLPRRGGGTSVDLVDVLAVFSKLQTDSPDSVTISEIVIDYPYALVAEDPALFRDRSRHLWNATRTINGSGAEGPQFGYITNSLSYVNACLKREPRPDIAFLPYVRGGKPLSEACQRAQIGKGNLPDGRSDSDTDYLRDSLAYADQLSPGGALAAQLVVSDGTRIPSHIAHFYMQSWGMNPMRNIWFADQLQCHLRDTC